MKRALALVLCSALIGPTFALAEDALSGRFLFRVVEQSEPHREALAVLVKGRGDLPNWVRNMVARGGYVALASVTVEIDGKKMERFSACEAHNCGESHVTVVYSADGKHAVMRVEDSKKGEVLLGDPSDAEKAELLKPDA